MPTEGCGRREKDEMLRNSPHYRFWLAASAAALCAACASPSTPAGGNPTGGGVTSLQSSAAPAPTGPEPTRTGPGPDRSLPAATASNTRLTPSAMGATPSATGPTPSTARHTPSTRDSHGTAATAPCPTTGWGTGAVTDGLAMSTAPLYLVRVGRHACFDRVVFDVNGPEAVGFDVRYVPMVKAAASGSPVMVAGRAALRVVVQAPFLGTDSQGHQPWRSPPAVGDDLVTKAALAEWASLREVTFAGSFEGQTTIAVGVGQRLPFRVFVTASAGYRHVVIDIAH